MAPWWRQIRRRTWVIIVLVAVAIAALGLLWLDAEGAGDSRLCGLQAVAAEGFSGFDS